MGVGQVTYEDTIFSGMNIHKSQLFWGSLGVTGFWPIAKWISKRLGNLRGKTPSKWNHHPGATSCWSLCPRFPHGYLDGTNHQQIIGICTILDTKEGRFVPYLIANTDSNLIWTIFVPSNMVDSKHAQVVNVHGRIYYKYPSFFCNIGTKHHGKTSSQWPF